MNTSTTRSMMRVLTVLALMLALFALPFVARAAGPTIKSDLPDYGPGDTVTLSGAGWQAVESVHIFVNDDAGQTWSHSVDVVAAADGTIIDSFQLPSWFVATYTVTATGASGTATTTFTDGSLQFVETGLPSGTLWSVTWNGNTQSSTTNTVTFGGQAAGPFSYTVGSVTGYTASPASGSASRPQNGNTQVNITFNVSDTTPPVISYVLTPASPDGSNGWYKSNVTLVWSVTDPESAVTKTGCVDQNITADQAATTYTCSATSAGGSSGPVSVTIKRDATPPILTLAFTPDSPDGTNGWWKTPGGVPFAWTCSDATSGIDTSYNGGCPSPLSGTETAQGTTNFSDQVRDMAGNLSVAVNRDLKLDNMAPYNVSGTANRPADHNGWYNHAVDVVFTGTDDTSGIDSCTTINYSGSDGSGLSVNGTCTDVAGNTGAPVASNAFDYDATAPYNVSGAPNRPADHNGWYNHTVDIVFTGSDATSGIDTCTTVTYSSPDGSGLTVNGSCTDKAGNTSASVASSAFDYDATAPTLTLTFTPNSPDGNNGWWKTPGGVPFAWTCSDGTSGIDNSFNGGCPSPLSGTETAQGTTNFSDQVKDLAGNLSVAVNRDLKLDNVAPNGVSGVPNRPADHNGWYNHAVDIVFTGNDATSGVATCSTVNYSGPDDTGVTVQGTCTDKAGNTSDPVASSAFDYDATAPTLNINGAASGNFNVCSVPARPTFDPKDNLSGIDAGNTGDSWSTPPSFGLGTYTYSAHATDNAGNMTSETRTYVANSYGGAFGGYLQPINTDGSSRFKLGSTVPVKFQLMCGTTPIANAVAKLYVSKVDNVPDAGVDEAVSTAASTTGNLFRYDSSSQQYIFNLNTKAGYVYTNPDNTTVTLGIGTWYLKTKLDDGSWQVVKIQLPK